MEALIHQRKSSALNNSNTTFCLSLHYNGDNSYVFVSRKEVFTFKADNKNDNFLTQFCSASILNRFHVIESREVFSGRMSMIKHS